MSLLMDALRRAESGSEEQSADNSASADTVRDDNDSADDFHLEPLDQPEEQAGDPEVELSNVEIDVMLDFDTQDEDPVAGEVTDDDIESTPSHTAGENGNEQPAPPAEQPAPSVEDEPQLSLDHNPHSPEEVVPAPAQPFMHAQQTSGGNYKTIAWFLGGLLTVVVAVGSYYFIRNAQDERQTLIDSTTTQPVPVYEGLREQSLFESGAVKSVAESPAPAAVTPTQPAAVPQTASAAQPYSGAPTVQPRTDVAPPAHIKIHKNTRSSSVQPTLQQAFRSYQLQDYSHADSLYREVLKRYPNNRDALLGLAATAVLRGDYVSARRNYEQVLRSDPSDTHARLGLQAIQGSEDPLAESSELKLLIDKQPGNAQLHFSLANRYAQLQQWKEAQLAYFDALRLKPDQPDYAYNLAVSLDHLGLQDQALTYYLRAEDLALRYPAVFDRQQLKTRVIQLRKATGDKS